MNIAELEWALSLQAGDGPRCEGCGRLFFPEMYRMRRSDWRYCSGACRTRAWRDRKASAQPVTTTTDVTALADA